ncbi:MAG: LPP20 family lipoprotein [Armatimonadetes bacterium]|nr:LPP20 family lipoprotein [Armatimonadota bacterium]
MSRRAWPLLLLASAALAEVEAPADVAVRLANGRAEVNWTAQEITAVGYGPPQEAPTPAAARVKQRRVAIADAYRLLAEAVAGVQVTSESTVAGYQLAVKEIRTRVDAVVSGQEIIGEWVEEDGTVAVTIAAPLAGKPGSVASVILPHVRRSDREAAQSAGSDGDHGPLLDVPARPPAPPSPLPARQPGPYTGLVVDARGFGLLPAMSPRLVSAGGAEVWSVAAAPPELLQSTGAVGYVSDLSAALGGHCARVGDNPLVVRALGRHGSLKANPVLSLADAQTVQQENARSRFLDRLQVVFVVDG